MDHDPINDKAIINTHKYKIELSKNEVNIWITIYFLKEKDKENDNREKSFKIKISDFTLIDSYFNPFNGNIKLIFNYLLRIFHQNLFFIEKDKFDTEKLVIKIDCLKENKKEFITIQLDNLNKMKKEEEKSLSDNFEENNFDSNSLLKNYLAAPIVKNINKRDTNNYFYYKNKEKDNEYNIFINKNEFNDLDYKEIIFKIIEKNNSKNEEYYAFLNLVDFFHMSEYYFSQFNYSIDEIYDDLLIIFSNHNYKIEKAKYCLKISIGFISSYGKNKNFITRGNINTYKIEQNERNINDITNEYYFQLIKYIKKFGENVYDDKFRKLIKEPDKFINDKAQKEKEKAKDNKIKNFLNYFFEEFEKKNNIIQKSHNTDLNSQKNEYNKDVNIVNNNIIITNKNIVDIYIKESQVIKDKNNEKYNNKQKIQAEKKQEESTNNMEKEKYINIYKINENEKKINIIIEKEDTKELMNRYININDIKLKEIKSEKNNFINEEKNLNANPEKKEEENLQFDKYKEKDKQKNEKEKEIEPKNNPQNNNNNISQQQKREIIENKSNENISYINNKEHSNNNDSINNLNTNQKENINDNNNNINANKKENNNDSNNNINANKKDNTNDSNNNININKKENIIDSNNNININKKENINDNINEDKNSDINPFFLNKKRKQKIFEKEKIDINKYDPIDLFINAILTRRKRLYNNSSLLTDYQLIFLIRKIEKTIPEFRYINLQIHTEVIFTYDINKIQNDNKNTNFETSIIKEFYEKTKNKNNLIFLIKTKNKKLFGGFSELGFNQENNENIDENSFNSFVFSVDKMKIYDYIGKNENCVIGYRNRLPEFKNQILFEDNNLKVGFTGNKKLGFLMEEDYELNDGKKMFYINQIQVICLRGFNL